MTIKEYTEMPEFQEIMKKGYINAACDGVEAVRDYVGAMRNVVGIISLDDMDRVLTEVQGKLRAE